MSMRLMAVNDGDTATLTSTSFLSTLPVTNLQLEGRTLVARTTNATGTKTINGNFSGVTVVRACILYGHNLSGTASWRLRLYDGASQTGTIVYDSGTDTPNPPIGWGGFSWGSAPWGTSTLFASWERQYFANYSNSVQALSFKIDITDASNPYGYIQAKRLLIGNYFEPTVNIGYGASVYWEDNSQQRRTQGGSIRTDARVRYRVAAGNLQRLDASERAAFMEALRTAGMRNEIFFTLYPEYGGVIERDHSLIGKLTAMPKITTSQPSNWTGEFRIEEV